MGKLNVAVQELDPDMDLDGICAEVRKDMEQEPAISKGTDKKILKLMGDNNKKRPGLRLGL